MSFILAAIDGTGSRDWRNPNGSNSHVYEFYRDTPVDNSLDKHYWHGPDSVTGAECPNLIDAVVRWIRGRMRGGRPIAIVGHSRGGLVAICAARRLRGQHRVHFLGLYDAVNMYVHAWRTLTGDPISNAHIAAHARRNPSIGSRPFWGNCGTTADSGVSLRQEFFLTSHGGIGGDPNITGDPDPTADDSIVGIEGVPVPGGSMPVPNAWAIQGLHASWQADTWMRRQAHSAGLTLPKSQPGDTWGMLPGA